jgi:hypothetical protein
MQAGCAIAVSLGQGRLISKRLVRTLVQIGSCESRPAAKLKDSGVTQNLLIETPIADNILRKCSYEEGTGVFLWSDGSVTRKVMSQYEYAKYVFFLIHESDARRISSSKNVIV